VRARARECVFTASLCQTRRELNGL